MFSNLQDPIVCQRSILSGSQVTSSMDLLTSVFHQKVLWLKLLKLREQIVDLYL